MLAQDVAAVLPALVGLARGSDGEEYHTVDYQHLSAVLVKAVQEQQTQIEEYRQQLNQQSVLLAQYAQALQAVQRRLDELEEVIRED